MVDDLLKRAIIKEIALHSPFSLLDVDAAYDRLSSFDKVIEFANNATIMGYSTIEAYMDFYIIKEKKSGRFLAR